MGKFAAWTVLLALILYYIRRDVLHYPDIKLVRGAEHTNQQADTENRNSASLLLKKSADFDK